MDKWKFFDITHSEHVLCNPMSSGKFDEALALLKLGPEERVLDIATGKGEFLIRLAERFRIQGVGVDLSPFCNEEAKIKHQQRVPDALLRFCEMDGADFQASTSEIFEVGACIGASWIFNGHKGTLQALETMVTPAGWVVVGEPYWKREPAGEYLAALGIERNTYGTHHQNVEAGLDFGLEPMYTVVSSEDDWDRYEGLQWYAAEKWAIEHPEDPDVEQVLRRVRKARHIYLQWGRGTLGWAIYLYKKGGYGRLAPAQPKS